MGRPQSKPTDTARLILRFLPLPVPLTPNKHRSAIKHCLAVVFEALVSGGVRRQGSFWLFQAAAGPDAGLNRPAEGWGLLRACNGSIRTPGARSPPDGIRGLTALLFGPSNSIWEPLGAFFSGGGCNGPKIAPRAGIRAVLWPSEEAMAPPAALPAFLVDSRCCSTPRTASDS